jgi:hypothetical protein
MINVMYDYIMERSISYVPHRGPSLLLLASVHVALFAAGLLAGAALRQGTAFVTPYQGGEAVRQFFASNGEAVRISAVFFFASFVPLGIFAATIVSRLQFLGIRAAGSYIALLGGFGAAGMIALSGLCSWVLSVPEVSTLVAVTKAVYFLSFLLGGVGFAICFGLFAAGVSVTSYFSRLLPRWLVWFGLVIAAVGELSIFSLVAYPATFTIPITRFGGFVWLVAVAATLPKTRRPEHVTTAFN